MQGKYRIEAVLGQGGFGITYKAVHTMLGKTVAIKEFFPKEYCDRDQSTSHITLGTQSNLEFVEKLRKKFIKEAQNISKLSHDNVIEIMDIFEENGTAYYVMAYIDGPSLEQIVNQEGPLDPARALRYIKGTADALRHMHDSHMMHLDVKPANIMIRRKDDTPVLIDFGLSKAYTQSGGQTSTTPHGVSHGYSPLEQYNADGVKTFAPQTDIYSLGATLYKLLTGQIPPDATKRLEQQLEYPEGFSDSARRFVESCMALSKKNRPESMQQTIAMLEEVDNTQQPPRPEKAKEIDDKSDKTKVISKPASPSKPTYPSTPKRKKSRKGLVIALGIGIVVLGIICAVVATQGPSKKPVPVPPVQESEIAVETVEAVTEEVVTAEEETPTVPATPDPAKIAAEKAAKEKKEREAKEKALKEATDKKKAAQEGQNPTPTPTTDKLASVKIAASGVPGGNMETGIRCNGASVQGNALVFSCSVNSKIVDESECSSSNPYFRQAISHYLGTHPQAQAAINLAKSKGMSVRFAFSGPRSFSISH